MSMLKTVKYLLPLTLRRWLKHIPLVGDITYEEMNRKYEIQTQAAIQRIVKPGWVCADVGSNLGFITMPLARLVGPQGRVVAFDAFPPNVASLKKRIERKKMADWVVVVFGTVVATGAFYALFEKPSFWLRERLCPAASRGQPMRRH